MVNSKFSGKMIQQPPPICKKPPGKPPIVPPPPPWPPMNLNAQVHWKDERPPGPPEFDFNTNVTVTRTPPEDDHYVGEKTVDPFIIQHWHNFELIEGKCFVTAQITKPGEWSYWNYPGEVFDFDLTQPFDPPVFRVYVPLGGENMWVDIKLTA